MINMSPLFEFQIRKFTFTRQKAINRKAGMLARKLAPDPLKAQYAACRQRCSMMKDRIMRFKARAMAMARSQIH